MIDAIDVLTGVGRAVVSGSRQDMTGEKIKEDQAPFCEASWVQPDSGASTDTAAAAARKH